MAAAGQINTQFRVILWLRNDLRLHDSAMLHRAVSLVKERKAKEVLPLYCFDPRAFGTTPFGSQKTGPFRAKFMVESVRDLKKGLQGVGSDLLVKLAKPEDAIQGLLAASEEAQAPAPVLVLTSREITSEEQRVDRAVARALQGKRAGQLEHVWGATLYHLDDLPVNPSSHDFPDVYTQFRNKVESKAGIRPLLPTPAKGDLPLWAGLDPQELASCPQSVEDLNAIVPEGTQPLKTPGEDKRAALISRGGESAALERLNYYLREGHVSRYFETRNGMLGGDFSTKFSPWLAQGCLSPRQIHHAIADYEKEHGSNKSTYWVTFELIWRDYLRFWSIKHGNKIFLEYGVTQQRRRWREDESLWKRWKEGRTGQPLVDANMRELALTGYMSNRGRQNVASYLALDLGIDWRRGADWFESVLTDYDVCSNWGNWVGAAGLTFGRVNHFNITKQSKDYDPEGAYIKTWVPELARVSDSRKIHEPWTLSAAEQERYGVRIGEDYPAPLPHSEYMVEWHRAGKGENDRPRHRGGPQGGGGGGRGGGHRGGGRGRGDRKPQHKSNYEMYG